MAPHCPQIKTKLRSLQREALHDRGLVTPLAFAQDLFWGPPPLGGQLLQLLHPLPREAFLDFSGPLSLDFSSTSLV